MIDWTLLWKELTFWLPPAIGVAICLFILTRVWHVMRLIRRDREISADVRKAYKYFKRIVERQREENESDEGKSEH